MTNSRPPHLEQNSDAKPNVAFWRSSPGRSTFASLICGVFGAAWILLHSPRATQILAPIAASANESTRLSSAIGNSLRDARPGRNRWDRLDGGQLRQPLYLANLACQTGDYIVSVQRVNSDRYTLSSNLPFGSSFSGAEPIRLRLQVMSTRTGKIQRIDRFKTELSVLDNTGYRLNVLEDTREYEFPDGRGCLFQLTAPPTIPPPWAVLRAQFSCSPTRVQAQAPCPMWRVLLLPKHRHRCRQCKLSPFTSKMCLCPGDFMYLGWWERRSWTRIRLDLRI